MYWSNTLKYCYTCIIIQNIEIAKKERPIFPEMEVYSANILSLTLFQEFCDFLQKVYFIGHRDSSK